MSNFKELYGETLNDLSKNELIIIIEAYRSCIFKVSETCVDESKMNIASDAAIEQIRNYLHDVDFTFYNEELLKKQIQLYNEK